MSETVISLSSNSIDKAIDKYYDTTSYSGSSSSTSNSSSGGNSTDEGYTFGVHGVPLEVFREKLRKRATSRSHAGTLTSALPSSPLDEEKTVYSCVVGDSLLNKDMTHDIVH